MAYLLRYNAAQGTTSEITFPTWVGAGNGNWSVIVSFICTSFSSTPRILGQLTSTTNRALVIGTTGFLSWVNVGIAGAAGSIQLNTRYWVKLESVGTIKNLYQSTDGVNYTLVGTATYSAANMDWSKLGSASNVRSQVFDFYSIEFSGSTYTDAFDATTAPSTGTSWPSVGGTRNLTLSNFTGTADSWWVFYDAGGGADTSLNASGQAVASGVAALTTAIMLAAAGAGVASGTASLSTSIRLQANGAAVASGTAQLTTQISLSASGAATASGAANLTAGSTSMSAAGQALPVGYANLTTSISLAASGVALPSGAANLTTGIRLQASGQAVPAGFASLQTGNAELSASGQAYPSGYADLTTGISLSAAGYASPSGYASMHTEIRLSAAGVAVASGSADLRGERIPVIKRSVTINLERKSAAITIERRSFTYSPAPKSFKVTLNG